jgi:hypothetical protein
MSQTKVDRIVNFLCDDLSLSDESVRLALKQSQVDRGTLPIVLWQSGLVNLQQLDRIFDLFESYIC